MTSFSLPTLKRLCMLSNNRCAFPGCTAPLSEATGTVTGEVCHIRAASVDGPRYDPHQSEKARHSLSNLVFLCSRHHKIIDSEINTYTVEVLQAFKCAHEQKAIVEITPAVSKFAEAVFQKYSRVVVESNSGQMAINSPGAIQINSLTLKTQKAKVTIAPILGSVGSDSRVRGYIKYLIDRYNEFQKADKSKLDGYKYIAIYKAIEREFGTKWDHVPESQFPVLVAFLQKKIDMTILGRNKKSKQVPRYHEFNEHP
jgi:hypothetical protein